MAPSCFTKCITSNWDSVSFRIYDNVRVAVLTIKRNRIISPWKLTTYLHKRCVTIYFCTIHRLRKCKSKTVISPQTTQRERVSGKRRLSCGSQGDILFSHTPMSRKIVFIKTAKHISEKRNITAVSLVRRVITITTMTYLWIFQNKHAAYTISL